MAGKVQRNPTWITVVAAAILHDDGRLLMHRRPAGKHHGGLWEFPGGKVEMGEMPAFALVREIEEELGLKLEPAHLEPVCFAEGAGEDGGPWIVILLYTARTWTGEPDAREGGEWSWFTSDEAAQLAKPPLDLVLMERLTCFAA